MRSTALRYLTLLLAFTQTMPGPLAVSVAADGQASAPRTFVRADVSFIPWYVLTRHALSPDEAREAAYVKVSFRQSPYVGTFVAWLRLDQLHSSPAPPDRQDARVVIDVTDEAGKTVTYYASRFALLTADGAKWRPIDDSFHMSLCEMALSSSIFGAGPCSDIFGAASNHPLQPPAGVGCEVISPRKCARRG